MGVILVTIGTGLLIEKLMVLETLPPGVGLVTVTGTVPGVVMAEAGMEAVNFVVLTNCVAMA